MTTQLAVAAALGRSARQWKITRLRNVATRRKDQRGDSEAELLSLESIGRLVPRLADRQAPADESLPRYALLEPGDLVVNPMWLTGGSVAVSDMGGAVSPDYRVFSLNRELVHPRFLHHTLRSVPYLEQYRLFVRADTTFDRRIQQGDLDNLLIPLPPMDEQRRIADFLDDQVARIERAIRARDAQRKTMSEVFLTRAGELLPVAMVRPALASMASVVDTEHKTAPTVPGGGYWIAGTSALRRGDLDTQEMRETDIESFRKWTRRAVPRVGDVLLSREAPVGEVALLQDGHPLVAVGQRVVLVRPFLEVLHPGFLRLILMSPVLQRAIADASVGSLHPHLNMSEIRRLRVPIVDIALQVERARIHQDLLSEERHVLEMFADQVRLLAEYKQALISAAVSGEFDVTAASGRALPV